MKKRLYWVLTMIALLGLTACGTPEPVTQDKPEQVTKAVTSEPEDTKVPEAEPTVPPEVTEEPVIEPTVVPTVEPTKASEPTATPEPTSTPEPTATPAPTSTPEPTATPEPTSTPEPTATPKPTATPAPTVVPEKKDTRFEDGMETVMKLIDAYDDLIEYGEACEYFMQTDLEMLSWLCSERITGLKTKDGKEFNDAFTWYAVGCMYYYNYVNKNTGYYDMEDWVCNQESAYSINQMVFSEVPVGESAETNECLMFEAPALIKWFKQAKSIKGYDFTETNEYTISGIKSSYIIKLNVDGDKTCTAVFDKDDNLLNICTSELFNENNYIPSNILN